MLTATFTQLTVWVRVNATVVGLLKTREEICETAIAQLTLIPFADRGQVLAVHF